MKIRDVKKLKNDKGILMEHDWVPLEDISPKLQLAVVCSEDQNYKTFWGRLGRFTKSHEGK